MWFLKAVYYVCIAAAMIIALVFCVSLLLVLENIWS